MSHNQKKKDENIEHFKIGKAKGTAAALALMAMIFFVFFIAAVLYNKKKGTVVVKWYTGLLAVLTGISSFLTIIYMIND